MALLALLVGACTPGATPAGSPDTAPTAAPSTRATAPGVGGGGTLRIALSVDPASVDPRFVADDEGELVVGALFEPLVALDEGLRVRPAAATSWEVEDDGRRFVFRLREARFHDGTPVTADDFVRSFTRLLDASAQPPSYLGHLLETVLGAEAVAGGEVPEGLRAPDARTLEIELAEPRPGFLQTLADPSLVPLPASADDDLEDFGARPVGNGPFTMVERREPGQYLRLTRNPDHHRPPRLDEVVLSVYPDDTARDQQWHDLLDGQLHVAEVPVDRLEEARERFGTAPDGYRGPGVLDGITSTVYLYGFDTTRPPFDDVRLRRALSLAIDRERLAAEVLAGSRAPAYGVVPPPVPGAQARACGHCRHDPDEALALWQEVAAERAASEPGPDEVVEGASGPDDAADGAADPTPGAVQDLLVPPVTPPAGAVTADEEAEPRAAWPAELATVTLTHSRGRTHAAIAERMARDIEEALGVDVELEPLEFGPFVQQVRSHEASVFRIGWETNDPDPGAYLAPLFSSQELGRDNLTGFADDEVDALLDEASRLPEPAAARARYREAERRILDEQPVLPLLWYRQSRVVTPEVSGLRWSPFGRIDLSSVRLASG
ncbi:peptide ABC transporter substrate-binding protein [Egicoccus halophilus]|uniref:peptide ABC transporter substrate-binding protein n=1 Tax=Egicoccus halophilus TaxID=1670830 RepID=UPI0013EE9B8A|nr:peptide ABC transporter substrate-binding protein [Egicoccus halophilus]